MKAKLKLLSTFIIASFIFLSLNANAQTVSKGALRIAIGADGLLPVGNLKNTVNFRLGITPDLQYGLTEHLALTFTTGFYQFSTKKLYINDGLGAGLTMENSLEIIPVKIGLKAFVLPNFYVSGEVGLGLEVEEGGGPTNLILAPGVGYASKHWDFGVRYESFSKQDYSAGLLGLRVTYGFGR
ncbi:hypothetical protein [Mucilaginibacter aquaedulcis]|uniref:hypothetical protein n=1 Tax=Mucilaginibacter aquaedulcis TaxID=1187081 RepID=UPI0025B51A56|nr:hypothetical protein [Mucilaginibacter aquaedulcis]MDN3548356.1 hypothetical protein [Mucilaginibacter aquaedulcis]